MARKIGIDELEKMIAEQVVANAKPSRWNASQRYVNLVSNLHETATKFRYSVEDRSGENDGRIWLYYTLYNTKVVVTFEQSGESLYAYASLEGMKGAAHLAEIKNPTIEKCKDILIGMAEIMYKYNMYLA